MRNKAIKTQLLALCKENLDVRLKTVKTIIDDLQQSLQSETKSSAGDKHETGRAMVQLEREKSGNQLSEIQKIQVTLSKINPEYFSKTIIGLGSVVITTKANYFIAISSGELTFEKDTFYAISPNTPIGLLLLGKTVGDTITFRGTSFDIVEVL
ncbi:3-oxoacyl-ACP synthase [Aurantibacter sp.]|uniref:3-oxoacyl-ACP synthase n=1 Tax=Aurantibacter sp. TaxID=2807103 RepID=UPI0035C7EF7F